MKKVSIGISGRMHLMSQVRPYFADAYTAKGYVSYFESNLQELDRLMILKGPNDLVKTSLMKRILQDWNQQGFSGEEIRSPFDSDTLYAVIHQEKKIAIVDGTKTNAIEAKLPRPTEISVSITDVFDLTRLQSEKENIERWELQSKSLLHQATISFAEALRIHDAWETIYIQNMNFQRANTFAEEMKSSLLGDTTFDKQAILKHRLIGASTPAGSRDFVPQLTSDIKRRVFIKGRPGTGKSTLLKKLLQAAQAKGVNVEVYHCGFDPDSLDMLIMRELDLAIFDSTAPHEYFPSRPTDQEVDLYKETVAPGTDERMAHLLEDIQCRYAEKIQAGTTFLAKAKKIQDQIKKIYHEATDFEKLHLIEAQILHQLTTLS